MNRTTLLKIICTMFLISLSSILFGAATIGNSQMQQAAFTISITTLVAIPLLLIFYIWINQP